MKDDSMVFVEDVLGEFGFRVVWWLSDCWADVKAFEITARDGEDGTPMFNRKDWKSLPDPVKQHDKAEIYLEGFVKFDGCSEFDLGRQHFCGPMGYKKHCDLLKHIYHRAFEMMGREPEEKWEE